MDSDSGGNSMTPHQRTHLSPQPQHQHHRVQRMHAISQDLQLTNCRQCNRSRSRCRGSFVLGVSSGGRDHGWGYRLLQTKTIQDRNWKKKAESQKKCDDERCPSKEKNEESIENVCLVARPNIRMQYDDFHRQDRHTHTPQIVI